MTRTKRPEDEPLGKKEVAELIGVQDNTIKSLIYKRAMPAADFEVNGKPAWKRKTILAWAGSTGRARTPELRAEYLAVFGHEALPPQYAGPLPGSPGALARGAAAAAKRRDRDRARRRWDEDELRKQWAAGVPTRVMAANFGCSKTAIAQAAISLGLPQRVRGHAKAAAR